MSSERVRTTGDTRTLLASTYYNNVLYHLTQVFRGIRLNVHKIRFLPLLWPCMENARGNQPGFRSSPPARVSALRHRRAAGERAFFPAPPPPYLAKFSRLLLLSFQDQSILLTWVPRTCQRAKSGIAICNTIHGYRSHH